MNLIAFIRHMFPKNTMEDIIRMLDKVTIINYDGTNILVASKEHIYFFGSTRPTTKQFKKFYLSVLPMMIGKGLDINKNVTYIKRIKPRKSGGFVWLG